MAALRGARGVTVQLCPDHHWIEIELVNDDGEPVPGEAYELVLPNGQRQAGTLDGNGWARADFQGESGDCEIRFPNVYSKELKEAAGSPLPPREGA